MNEGKKFEQDFRNSMPEDVFYYRLRDGTAAWSGGYYIPLSMAEVEFSLREDNSRISRLIADREAKRAMAREQGL